MLCKWNSIGRKKRGVDDDKTNKDWGKNVHIRLEMEENVNVWKDRGRDKESMTIEEVFLYKDFILVTNKKGYSPSICTICSLCLLHSFCISLVNPLRRSHNPTI